MRHRRFQACKHRTLLLWVSILLIRSGSIAAQSAEADSLARLLARAPEDTSRVMLQANLAWAIQETQTEKADTLLRFGAIPLAQRLQFVKGEAFAWNVLGVVEETRGNYAEAVDNYRRALTLRRQIGDPHAIGSTLNNLGVVYEATGRFDSALVFHRENLAIQQELKDTVRIARAQFNIAAAYQEMGLYNDAQEHLYEARGILEVSNDLDGVAKVAAQLGHIQFELDRYADARKWYALELQIREQLRDTARLADALSDYANALDELDSSETAIRYYLRALDIWKRLDDLPGQVNVYINISDAHKHVHNYQRALQYLDQAETLCRQMGDEPSLMEVYNIMGDVYSRMGQQQRSLDLIRQYYDIALKIDDSKFIQSAYKDFAEVYAAMGDYKKAYENRVLYDELRYKRLNEKIGASFARKEGLYESEQKEKQIEQQKQELALNEALLAKSTLRQYLLLGGGIALLLLVALLFNRNRLRARNNRELAAKNAVIERERQRADALLTNILPATTAQELKENNSVEPRRYESVTVMFTDFKSFTQIAERVSFEELITELDECFRLFDQIVEQFHLEKIKTIGDAYMCAGGLPVPNDTHPVDVVRAAIDMQTRLQALMRDKQAAGKPVFEMRIGIHTGPVVAGVVGSHKFAYDIWGDTVNTAARLEQGSESGKINISETTYQAVKDLFPCTYRGKLAAKNKGEIDMYFVEY